MRTDKSGFIKQSSGSLVKPKQRDSLFKYYLSDTTHSIEKNSAIWNASFPVHFQNSNSCGRDVRITYGDYFRGTREFLQRDHFYTIVTVCSECLKATIRFDDINAVHIHLEKHGPFYHPARIRIWINSTALQFTLNVAISAAGKRIIAREYMLLKKLHTDFPDPYLPEVYHLNEISIGQKNLRMIMFMGEWCEGFHEFHISKKHADGRCTFMLWDPLKGKVTLTPEQVRKLYQKAATILTCYYNPQTFEQIFPWYHAAGDFVVKAVDNTLDMKLISVRQYRPMIRNEDADFRDILEAMLVFLLNLSIWTRIDRLDGVGIPVWADERAIDGTLNGFYEGLSIKKATDPLIEPLSVCFKEYISSLSKTHLYDLAVAIVNTYHPNKPETSLIHKHLKDHVTHLLTATKSWKN